ncbi:hypothetical protein, partial [Candidatus Flexifilum breve]|uniref:hypothetical protein n=1 Tax=Candidatus Flexifilum breve TaxID=3140694 RepID=UPI0031CC570D
VDNLSLSIPDNLIDGNTLVHHIEEVAVKDLRQPPSVDSSGAVDRASAKRRFDFFEQPDLLRGHTRPIRVLMAQKTRHS